VLRQGRQRCEVLQATLQELTSKANADIVLGECMHQWALAMQQTRWEGERRTLDSRVEALQVKLQSLERHDTGSHRAPWMARTAPDREEDDFVLDVSPNPKSILRSPHGARNCAPEAFVAHSLHLSSTGSWRRKIFATLAPALSNTRGCKRMEVVDEVVRRAHLGCCLVMWSRHVHQSHALVTDGAGNAAARALRDLVTPVAISPALTSPSRRSVTFEVKPTSTQATEDSDMNELESVSEGSQELEEPVAIDRLFEELHKRLESRRRI